MKHYIFLSIFLFAFSFALQAQEPEEVIPRAEEEVNVLFGTQKYGRFVGNATAVKGEDLLNYPTLVALEALAGRLPGVFMQQNSAEPGVVGTNFNDNIFNNYSIYVRGSTGGYITLINGVERDLTPFDIEQIEEVRVLKDAVSKLMYGGRMCNGIIMVTTKTGKSTDKNEFRVNLQQGWKTPTRLPKFLNSYDFAMKYNEALTNDGLTAGRISDAALEGYRNGNKPIQYPDVNFHDEFLNNFMNMTRANAEYYGGKDQTVYYVHGGFQNEGGLEKYGNHKTQNNSFNLQGNIETTYSEFITLYANITGIYKSREYPGAGTSFAEFSNRRPNAYPIFADVDKTKFGGVSGMLANPMALQTATGYTQENYMMAYADIGLNFKLDNLIKGLSFKPSYAYDVYNQQNLNKRDVPGIWGVSNFNDQGIPGTVSELQRESKVSSQSVGTDVMIYRWAFNSILSWAQKFGDHEINADAQFYMSRQQRNSTNNDYKRQNNTLRLNYTYSDRYTVEGGVVYAGSERYSPDKRFKLLPSFGAGWLLSEESFLKDVEAINFLKLNASWGILGDGNISAALWRETWDEYGNQYVFNESHSQNPTTFQSRMPNWDLDWPTMRQFDVNVEAVVFNKISGKISYFDYLQSGLVNQKTNILPHLVGSSRLYPNQNYNSIGLKGTEVELRYLNSFGKLRVDVGAHYTYSKSNRVKYDENPDPLYSTVGTPNDAVRGYLFDGYYSDAEIAQIQAGTSNLGLPSYMDPKSLRAGDMKYRDLNGDGILNRYDTEIIGNSAPRSMFGGDINLQYGTEKSGKIELNLLFMGYGNYNRNIINNYYLNYSTRKYTNVLVDGLPNGNPHPKITTQSMTNDSQTSDYWIVNGSYLKLRSAVLAYSLPNSVAEKMKMSSLKISLYGTNLLTFSKIKDLDPESLNAGLEAWPLFRTLAIGLSANF